MLDDIEQKREELYALIKKLEFELTNKEIIEISEELDTLIADYYKDIELN